MHKNFKTNTPFPSANEVKKMSVYAYDGKKLKLLHFGAKGYEDFTMHRDELRKERYFARHEAREDWSATGIFTAGFWSRWVLWNLESIHRSVIDVQQRFDLPVEDVNSIRKIQTRR